MAKSQQQKEIDGIFSLMENAIRLHEYDAADLFYMVADLTPVNPVLAVAIGKHTSDFIKSESCTTETSWTDIVVEAYRRALFDEEFSRMYGTDYFIGKPDMMTAFVDNYIRQHTFDSDPSISTTTAH